MKKTYINPVMNIVKIESQQQIMAGSTLSIGFGSENKDGGAACGREDDWDDWED